MKATLSKLWKFTKIKFAKEENDVVYHAIRDNGPVDYITIAFGAVMVFILYYKYAFTIMINEIVTDLSCHAEFAEAFYLKKDLFLKAWLRVPYMFWHLITKFFESRMDFPMSDATAMTYGLFGVFAFVVMTLFIYKLVLYYTGKASLGVASVGALALSFVGAYAKWWFTPSAYLGQFSPNPFHNPTHMAVKGFGLLAAMAGIDIIKKLKDEKLMFYKKGVYVWFGVMLFLSTLTKPTFMYMLLPAGFIYMLGILIHNILFRKDKISETLMTLLYTTLATLPSLFMIAFEYLAFYTWGTDQYGSKVIIGEFLETWHTFSPDVPTSICLAMCFPIWMIITNPGFFMKTTEGLLSVMCYAVGTMEFAFIQEEGIKKGAANFSWCMMAGMTVLFTTCVAKLIHNTMQKKDSASHISYIVISWMLLFLHVYSGYTIVSTMIDHCVSMI